VRAFLEQDLQCSDDPLQCLAVALLKPFIKQSPNAKGRGLIC
jgi:hypothetical protein